VELSFLYRRVRRLVEVARLHGMDDVAKDAEILVLRHQLVVLGRQVTRPGFWWADRALVAAFARLVPRERWAAFVVTPETILRWHGALARRYWTYAHRRSGRPALPGETVELIVGLAGENPRWGYLGIAGELKKLGVRMSKGSVANVWVPRTRRPSSGDHPVLVDEPAQLIGSSNPGEVDVADKRRSRIERRG
jgi:putative transposase